MRRTIIRKEKYGLLVFDYEYGIYYHIYDTKLANLILECFAKNDFQRINDEYPLEYKKLKFKDPKLIDNSNLDFFVPLEAYFDYTAKCNRNCDYCYNKKYLGNTTMSKEMVRKVFDYFQELGIMRVHLAGGEPTIDYEGIKNYIEYSNQLGFVVSMATNGSFLNDKMCELLTSNNLLSVSISIDSPDEEINDQMRGAGSTKLVKDGVERLSYYKARNNSKTEICFKPVYYPNLTEQDIVNFINLSKKYGIQKLKFANPERCEDHEKGYYGSIKKEYYETLKILKEVLLKYKDCGIEITNITNPFVTDFIIGIEGNRGCIGAQELITINPDGRITPCLMNHTYLGNIYEYKDLKDFYNNSKELREYLQKIQSYECGDCRYHVACRGGCQVRKKVEYGKIMNTDPLCPKDLIEREKEEKQLVMRKVNVFHSL